MSLTEMYSVVYGKCPKILNALFHTFLAFLFIQLFFKVLSGMANSVDPDQTKSNLIWICTVCLCHFVRNFGV